jgi:hypothetical protein
MFSFGQEIFDIYFDLLWLLRRRKMGHKVAGHVHGALPLYHQF